MGTALIYLLVMIVVAAAVFVGAALVFGRGEELAPLPRGASPTRLPVEEVGGDDVRTVRFQQVLRGYRMSEVDWVLERLASELDRIESERDQLRCEVAELEASPAGQDPLRNGPPREDPLREGMAREAPAQDTPERETESE